MEFCTVLNCFSSFFLSTQIGNVLRCPVGKFNTHTLSHLCFLLLLAAATFRIDERTYPINSTNDLNVSRYDLDELSYEEKVESLLKSTFRPASTLMTHVQMTLMFWILGQYYFPVYRIPCINRNPILSVCIFVGLLWMECKQMYNSGLRVYLLDTYNIADFAVLSLYLSSYVLRFMVDHWIKQADQHYNGTAQARHALLSHDYDLFNEIKTVIFDESKVMDSKKYFMRACKCDCLIEYVKIIFYIM